MVELTVKKVAYYQPVAVLETDIQGRPTVVMCPFHHEPARVPTVEGERIRCELCVVADGLIQELYQKVVDSDVPVVDLPADSPLRVGGR